MTLIDRLRKLFQPDTPRIATLDMRKGFYDASSVIALGSSTISRPHASRVDTSADNLAAVRRKHEIVYACVRIRAASARDPRLIVERRQGDGTYLEDEAHPFRRLIVAPNPDMDDRDFIDALITSYDTTGVVYVEVVRSEAGLPAELWPLDPTKVREIKTRNADGSESLSHYEWRDGTFKSRIEPENMLVRKGWNMGGSTSLLSVVLGAVDLDMAQTEFARAFFANGGVPSGIIKVYHRTLSEEESLALRAAWQAKYGRSLGQQHSVAVFDENADFEKIGMSLEGLDNDTLRSVSESRICMTFGVPPLIIYAYVGLQRATYSNLQEAWASFWDATMSALLAEWRAWLTRHLLAEFEGLDRVRDESVRLDWDTSDVAWLQEDMDALHLRTRENFTAGLLSLNEARATIGLDPWEPGSDPGDFNPHLIAVLLQHLRPDTAPLMERLLGLAEGVSQALPPPEDVDSTVEDATIEASARQQPLQAASRGLERAQAQNGTQGTSKALALDTDALTALKQQVAEDLEPYLRQQYEIAAQALARRSKVFDAEQLPLDDGTILRRLLRRRYVQAIRLGHAEGANTLALELGFDVSNPRVVDTLVELARRVTAVTETTRDEIRALVGQANEEGWSVDRLAREVRERGITRSPVRAEMIANTEMADAHTRGALLAYRESGVVESKEWLVFQPCPQCEPLAGKRVPLENEFDNGKGWRGQGPPVHPRCRCAIAPIVGR